MIRLKLRIMRCFSHMGHFKNFSFLCGILKNLPAVHLDLSRDLPSIGKFINFQFHLGLTCDYVDSCLSNPCGKNARCIADAFGNYTCICDSGYTGVNCDQDIDECSSVNGPCDHGTCVNTNGSYYCNCIVGHTGE